MGKTVEFDIYPRGGHVLREPMQQREQMKRNLEWFTRWIKTVSYQLAADSYLKMLFGIRTWTPTLGLSTSCVTATLPARLTT